MAYDFSKFKKNSGETIEWLKKEYLGIRTGRATPTLLDNIDVESYGARQPIKHVASIGIEDPKTLKVVPWDKSLVKNIESALRAGNLGVSVAVDDTGGIRVGFPELTEETRKSIVKVVKELLEEARISLRKERERIWNDIAEKEKNGAVSEDEKFRAKDELQKLVDDTNKALEEVAGKKEKEIMTA